MFRALSHIIRPVDDMYTIIYIDGTKFIVHGDYDDVHISARIAMGSLLEGVRLTRNGELIKHLFKRNSILPVDKWLFEYVNQRC